MLDLIMKFIGIPVFAFQITLAIATVSTLVVYIVYQLVHNTHTPGKDNANGGT